ncbi:MAG: hypothetical protein J6C98_09410 [Oscillospiraceae bacterium]|nr:hypothetical protein [Oscillospiraceae bacterium]
MQKMIYLCPVDWRWIKQRPQFLAEELSKYFEIHAVYPYQNNRKGLQKKSDSPVSVAPCFSIPTFGGKLSALNSVNRGLRRQQVSREIREVQPDCIWVTMPWQLDWLPEGNECPIIYDCMDDYAAISMVQSERENLIRQEREIIRRAKVVFVSSENLRRVLRERHHLPEERLVLLRNGYNANWTRLEEEPAVHEGNLKIGYFGTIGRWFDFPMLWDSLAENDEVEYHLYGPMERGIQVPVHDRIVYHGVVEHDELQHAANDMDALMMPFVINDIVCSVDPIKLYEYIYLNKNILCIHYPEIQRFEPFVMFYESRDDFFRRIRDLRRSNLMKYTQEQADEFLARNSWQQRAAQAYDVIRTQIPTEDGK